MVVDGETFKGKLISLFVEFKALIPQYWRLELMHSIHLISLIVLLSFLPNDKISDHAIYVSVTEIELHQNGSSTVSFKIFADDLKAAIQNFSGKRSMEPFESFIDVNQEAITSYINKYFELNLGNKEITLEYENHTLEGDAYFINFNFVSYQAPSVLMIKARYLMELFPTQQNVVKINFEKEQRFLKFDSSTETQSVNFN